MKKLYVSPELAKFSAETDVIMASEITKLDDDYVGFWQWGAREI